MRLVQFYEVVAGRSAAALETYLRNLKGKESVRVVCMDLSSTYRALVHKHFPNARIVADRFHVLRLVGHHLLACWKILDPAAAKNRGLLSLLRRHRRNLKPHQRDRVRAYFAQQPAVGAVWRFKETLSWMLLRKHRTRHQCRRLIPRFLHAVDQLRGSGFAPLVTLGETLASWAGPDRRDVALYAQQRHHRRLPHTHGSPPAPGLWLPQFRQLPAQSESHVLARCPALLTHSRFPSHASMAPRVLYQCVRRVCFCPPLGGFRPSQR